MMIRLIMAWLLVGAVLSGGAGAAAGQQAGSPPVAKNQKIMVTSPQAHEVIHSPLTLEGKAKGAWFFEATFPVTLLDGNGQEIIRVPVHAKVENYWRAKGLVPFEGTMEFTTPATATGTLVFQNDNPSGLPENQEEFRMPVRFR
jgi:hypothetical protein